MTQTVSALYDTYDAASSAVNALEDAGIAHSDISRATGPAPICQRRIGHFQPKPCRIDPGAQW